MSVVVENLFHAYGRIASLRAINAAALAGRVTAVIGPNAAGKSTLLRCIAGMIKPRQGRAMINGLIAHRTRPRTLAKHLAFVPQRSTVSALFTVRQVVELGRFALTPSAPRIDQAIEQMDLVNIAQRPYPMLSVGQQQRVMVARALAQLEPGTGHLILDEPIAAMDLRHVRQTLQILRELAASGATVIMAIHDLQLAALAADDIWLINEGQLVAAGPATTILTPAVLEPVFGVRLTSSHQALSLALSA